MNFDFFQRVFDSLQPKREIAKPKPGQNRRQATPEEDAVLRVTTDDMVQFEMIPFDLNCPVRKHISPGGKPFAYMDLNRANRLVAKEELLKINEYIIQSYEYIPQIAYKAILHVGRIAFDPYSTNYGYTKLICTPYTKSGRVSKTPVRLSFMTQLNKTDYAANGNLFYGVDGNVLKADIHIHQNCQTPNYKGWSFVFKTVGRTFVLHEVNATGSGEEAYPPKTIYKFDALS